MITSAVGPLNHSANNYAFNDQLFPTCNFTILLLIVYKGEDGVTEELAELKRERSTTSLFHC